MAGRITSWVDTGSLDPNTASALDLQLRTTADVQQWWGRKRRKNEILPDTTQLSYACLYLDRSKHEGRPQDFSHIDALRRLVASAARILAITGGARDATLRLEACLQLCDDVSQLLALLFEFPPGVRETPSPYQLSKTKYEVARAANSITEVLEDTLADRVLTARPHIVAILDRTCVRWFEALARVSPIPDTSPNNYVTSSALTLALMAPSHLLRMQLLERMSSRAFIASSKGSLVALVAARLLDAQSRHLNPSGDKADSSNLRDFPIIGESFDLLLEHTVLEAWFSSIDHTLSSQPGSAASAADLNTWFYLGRRIRPLARFLLDPANRTKVSADLSQGLFAPTSRDDAVRHLLATFVGSLSTSSNSTPALRGRCLAITIEANKLLRRYSATGDRNPESQVRHALQAIAGLIDANEFGWQLSESFHEVYMAARGLPKESTLLSEAACAVAESLVSLVELLPHTSWVYWRAYQLVVHWTLRDALGTFTRQPATPEARAVFEAIQSRDGHALRSLSARVMWEHETLEAVPGGRSNLYRPARWKTLAHFYCVFKGFSSGLEASIEHATINECEQTLRGVTTLLANDRDAYELLKRMHVPSVLAPIFQDNNECLVALQSVAANDFRTALMMEDGAAPDFPAELTIDVVCSELPRLLAFVQAFLSTYSAARLKALGIKGHGELRPSSFRDECIKAPLKHGPFVWSQTTKRSVDARLRQMSEGMHYGRKIDCHHGNILIRERHYTFIDFHYTRSARPLGYELVQLIENARLLPVSPEGIDIRVRMMTAYHAFLPAWMNLLAQRNWQRPAEAASPYSRIDVLRMMLYEALRLLRQASAPEWRVSRPRDAAGMIEHADDLLRFLASCNDAGIAEVAFAAVRAPRRYDKERVSVSKAAAKILRHDSVRVGRDGWMSSEDLCATLQEWAAGANKRLRLVRSQQVVEALCFPSEDRFEVSTDLKRIRALHGHSIANYPILESESPPAVLYHGTSEDAWDHIQRNGLAPESRRFVHLFVERGKPSTTRNGTRVQLCWKLKPHKHLAADPSSVDQTTVCGWPIKYRRIVLSRCDWRKTGRPATVSLNSSLSGSTA